MAGSFARSLLVSTSALTLAGAPLLAQTAAPGDTPQSQADLPHNMVTPAPATADDAQTIVVTGSRIARPDFQSPAPIVSLDAATIQQSGTTNLTDFLTGYPALQGSATSADNSGDRAGIGETGLNLLNLRNLGTERTLVLIDGRRQVASEVGTQAVDINTIPSDLVERVDILTGGASAIYGADGVSGVVNFIMKQDFDGLTAHGQAGISQHGDAGQRLGGVTFGRNFAGGRGNIALAYEYSAEDELQSVDRARLSGTRRVGFFLNPNDPENKPGYTGSSNNGIPDNVPLRNVRYFDTASEGGIVLSLRGNLRPDYFVGSDGDLTPFDRGNFVPDYYQKGGNATLVSDYANDLTPRIRRNIVNATTHFDVSPALTLFAEGKFAQTESFSLSQPGFDYYLLIPSDNPYIPAGIRPLINPKLDSVLVNRDDFDFGQNGDDIRRRTYRFVGGARGRISDHATYEVSYDWGRTDIVDRQVNAVLNDRFYAAIDAVTDPGTGQPTCRINIDPTWTPYQPYTYIRNVINPFTFSPGQCVPLNLFGANAPSQAALDFIHGSTTDIARLEQQVASGSISGDFGQFFKLPGGAVGFALGAEYRKEKSSFTPDPLTAAGDTFGNILSADRGSFDVKEAFGELRAPVLKDTRFAYRLEFGAALRVSDYSTIGHTTAWKADGLWAPLRDISLTATYSRAVRAPNIGELFANQSQTFAGITDPCNVNQLQNGTQYRAANCTALLGSLGVADPGTYRDTRSVTLPGTIQGNPNLSEETANTWTAGIILAPRFVRGLTVRADWYDIKLKQAINTASAQELAQLCVDQPTTDNSFCAAITRQNGNAGSGDPGNIIGFIQQPFNVASFRTAGLDVNLSYRLETRRLGTFNLNVVANYLDRLEFIGTPGATVTNDRGENAGANGVPAPKYTVTSDLTWKKGPLSINYGLSWSDKTTRFSNQEIAGNPDIVAPEYFYIKALWQHDLYVSIDVDKRFQLYTGVNNFANQKPDIGSSFYPISSVGRYFYSGFRLKLR